LKYLLQKWFDEKISESSPFLSTAEKKELEVQTGLSRRQIINWFSEERKRRGFGKTRDNRWLPKSSVEVLKKFFDENISESNPFLSIAGKEELEAQTGLSRRQIECWFSEERKRRGLSQTRHKWPSSVIEILTQWYNEINPYPTKEEKVELAAKTGLTEIQVGNWFGSERYKRGEAGLKHLRDPPSSDVILKNRFNNKKSPNSTKEEKLQLATEANLTEKQVSRWFETERAKRKKVDSEISPSPSKKTKTNKKSAGVITATVDDQKLMKRAEALSIGYNPSTTAFLQESYAANPPSCQVSRKQLPEPWEYLEDYDESLSDQDWG
jgi:transcriptional regulator with XRE-family HTH domain